MTVQDIAEWLAEYMELDNLSDSDKEEYAALSKKKKKAIYEKEHEENDIGNKIMSYGNKNFREKHNEKS